MKVCVPFQLNISIHFIFCKFAFWGVNKGDQTETIINMFKKLSFITIFQLMAAKMWFSCCFEVTLIIWWPYSFMNCVHMLYAMRYVFCFVITLITRIVYYFMNRLCLLLKQPRIKVLYSHPLHWWLSTSSWSAIVLFQQIFSQILHLEFS